MILRERLSLKALVTGASGFVGGRLRDALCEAGADVCAVRRAGSPEPKQGRSVVCDYGDADALVALVERERPDVLFHVAGATKGVTYDDFARANVMPTRNLLAAVRTAHPGLRRFVLVSSLAAYGPSRPDRPHVETDEPRPIEHYGKSKLEAEKMLAAEAGGIPWTIFRPGGVYGPGDGDYFNLFSEVWKGRNLFFGNRKRWFSAIYVDDCVRALCDAVASEKTVGRGYFLCDGVPVTWEAFQDAIVRASGRRVRSVDLPGFLVPLAAVGGELLSRIDKKPRLFNRQKSIMGEQDAWTCRHDAARDDFGYHPQVPLDQGVRASFDWYREHGWL
jgi:nucleoside-diphosphate-sugar epimerase